MTNTKQTKPSRKKAPTKSEIISTISKNTGLTQKEVASVFEHLEVLIKKNLDTQGPGVFNMPGLFKIKVAVKPATKERKGRNPFTGEDMVFKAKPARQVVKILALRGLKEFVAGHGDDGDLEG